MHEFIRFVRCCKIIFKGCLFLRRGLKLKERGTQSEHNIVEPANDGHGEHRASREVGDRAHCGRE